MKMQNMGNLFVYFYHSSVPGVTLGKMAGVNCRLIQDRPSEPASAVSKLQMPPGALLEWTSLQSETSTNADSRHQEVWRPANLLLSDYDYCQRILTLFMF